MTSAPGSWHDAGLMLAHMQPRVVTPNFGDEFVDEGQVLNPVS